jgi:MSHA biogenesis protein MshL
MKTTIAVAVMLVLCAGCAAPPPFTPGLDPTIISELNKPAERKAVQPSATLEQTLLPPLRMEMPASRGQPIDQRFDLSVNNAPARPVFMSMAAGTRYSMLVHPSVSGNITVNLKDVTLREALDSLRDLYGYDYKVDGSRIMIQPAGMQTRIFQVNYMLGSRQGMSDLRVQSGSVSEAGGSAGATAPTTAGVTPATGAGTQARGLESSRITTRIQNDFWTELRTSLMAIIGTGDGRSVVISPQSGVVVIRALPAEIRGVEQYLRATRISVERQVMIEAKIIDVELNQGYQSGINWALLPTRRLAAGQLGSDTTITDSGAMSSRGLLAQGGTGLSTAGAAGAALLTGNPAAALFGLALQIQNFSALIQFLETQGKVQVLSSPRVATLNNQKAVLKVGTDEFFVTNIQSATTTTTTTGTTAGTPVPTVTVQPFFSGIVLDVTPQIDENNQIILHIRPSVSQVNTDNKDISLGAAGNLRLPLAKSSISETDSVVRVTDGNIVALGGLMKLDARDSRGGLPGTGDNPVGNFFRNTNATLVKKEMVILLKPTVIQGDRAWDEDLQQTRARFDSLGEPAPRTETPAR